MRHTILLAALLALFAAGTSGCGSYTMRGVPVQNPQTAPDFTLTDQRGQPFRLSEQRGKVVLLYFGFTSCPDVCPTTLADLAAARRDLGADAERVQVVFVSVDPEHDTTDVIGRYLARFDPSFVGLRGEQAELEPIFKAYGVTVANDTSHGGGHSIDHSPFVYAIDPAGKWRELFGDEHSVADITADVRNLARQG